METVEEVFQRLELVNRGRYRLEWIGGSKTAAVLYYQKGRRRFKIFFDDSNVEISQEKRWFRETFWDSLGVRHYDQPEDTVGDVYDTVVWCLQEFCGFSQQFGQLPEKEDNEAEPEPPESPE